MSDPNYPSKITLHFYSQIEKVFVLKAVAHDLLGLLNYKEKLVFNSLRVQEG